MKLFNKLLVLSLLASLGFSTSSLAYGHYGHPYHHHYHHHGYWRHDNPAAWIVGGLIAGATVAAVASSNNTTYYETPVYRDCERVIIKRRCHFDRWGYRHCQQTRRVINYC